MFGYLLGRYSEFTDVPLGIRAVVSAIYEPQQVRNVVVVNWRALEPKLNKHLWCGVVWWWCGGGVVCGVVGGCVCVVWWDGGCCVVCVVW